MKSLKVFNSSSNKNSIFISSEKYLLTPQSLPKGCHATRLHAIRPLLPNILSKQLSICSTYRVWQVKTLITIMRQSIIDIVLHIQIVLYQ